MNSDSYVNKSSEIILSQIERIFKYFKERDVIEKTKWAYANVHYTRSWAHTHLWNRKKLREYYNDGRGITVPEMLKEIDFFYYAIEYDFYINPWGYYFHEETLKDIKRQAKYNPDIMLSTEHIKALEYYMDSVRKHEGVNNES